jgi:hypothetical protein
MMRFVQSLEKPYVYVFYVLKKFFIDDWRAALVMTVFQAIIIGGVVCGVALAAGYSSLLVPKITLVLGTLGIYGITQYMFVRKARLQRYRAEFDGYSSARSNMASIAVWVGFVLVAFAGVSLIKAVIH